MMTAQFVIVCGGAGKGIMRRFGDMDINAVLQIDVDDELVRNNYDSFFTVQLPVADVAETNLNSVMSLMQYKQRLGSKFQQATNEGKYEEAASYERQINHVEAAVAKCVPFQLYQGMGQNPIIGRSYITRDLPTQHIRDQIATMLQTKMPPNENSVVFWLVASTCGGTSNGIVHHVADIVQQVAGDLQLTIKFVRIGSLTYSGLNELVHLSTLWAVLADYGYIESHRRKVMSEQTTSQLQFYYMDFPDIGKSKPAREEMILSAFAALSQKELNRRFEVPFVNLAAAPKVLLVRVGEWNRGFDRDSVYHQTLNQLQHALRDLLIPAPADALRQSTNVSWNTDSLHEVMNSRAEIFSLIANNQMLVIRALNHRSYTQLENINQVRTHTDWHMMESFVQKFVSQLDITSMLDMIGITLHTVDGDVSTKCAWLNSDKRDIHVGTAVYLNSIKQAQMVIAHCTNEVLGSQQSKGLMSQLYDAWNALLPYQRTGNVVRDAWSSMQINDERRVTAVKSNIGLLIHRYLQVEKALRIISEAEQLLADARSDLQDLTTTVDTELRRLGSTKDTCYTTCAALDDWYANDETWLQMLRRSLSGDPDVAIVEGTFRKAVEDGVKGLTEEGLRYVMNLPQISDVNNVVNELNTRAGANQAVWWQGMTPMRLSNLYRFSYRIFPRLPHGLLAHLESANRKWEDERQNTPPDYVEVSSMALGLKVYAVECTAPAQFFDNQVEQLIGQLCQYLDPAHNIYPKDFTVPDPDAWYSAYQCQRSNGLPVYVPRHWKDTQGFQETYYSLMRLSRYFNIIDSAN